MALFGFEIKVARITRSDPVPSFDSSYNAGPEAEFGVEWRTEVMSLSVEVGISLCHEVGG